MRSVYYLNFNNKCYYTTDAVEMLMFEDFMGMVGESKVLTNMCLYQPTIRKLV